MHATIIARGRSADIYDAGPDRVLRRYRDGRDASTEVAVMRHAAAHGFPVPRVHEAAGADMVLERIPGPTLGRLLARQPWRVGAIARQLRGLIDRLGQVPPLAGLDAPFGAGDRLLHLDLHPHKVLLGPDGPMVIGWANAACGAEGIDLAQTWLIVRSTQLSTPFGTRVAARATRASLAAELLAADHPARHWLPALAARRLEDPNVTVSERMRITRLATRT